MYLFGSINNVLKGRRTYLVAGLLALATFALSVGWIDQSTYNLVQGVLIPAGLASLRAGVGK